MNTKVLSAPFFVVLLPVFFVIHALKDHHQFIEWENAWLLTLIYSSISLIFFLVSYLFTRSLLRSAFISVIIMSVFFFFGAVQDFLKSTDHFKLLAKYSVLFVLTAVISALFFYLISRSHSRMTRVSGFLNILFLIFIFIDIGAVLIMNNNSPTNKVTVTNAIPELSCDTCSRPDIYFLLFDEYESSASLRSRFNFRNDLDSTLSEKGFSIQSHSRSNYNFTPFSIASVLNMSYLYGVNNKDSLDLDDYSWCNYLIANNHVCRLLRNYGYQVVNYSIFDLAGEPSLTNESFLPTKLTLITGRTLAYRVKKDLAWNLLAPASKDLYFESMLNSINNFISLVKQHAKQEHQQPQFVYAHLMMPHVPHFFDSSGKRRDGQKIYEEMSERSPEAYLGYLQYTNKEIIRLVDDIQKNNPSAVIMIMGDHGYRNHDPQQPDDGHFFSNFNAVYNLGGPSHNLYDSITGVNQFRAVFNDLFGKKYITLKDSSIMLNKVKRKIPYQKIQY
jgi:hypothetical protein